MEKQALIDYTLHLADSNLVLAQRNAEWCGHGPILEQDIAITNISLDLLGQARNFYQYAAQLINNVQKTASSLPHGEDLEGSFGAASEDTLAYLRTEREFKNVLLAEQPNGHWGQTILRQFFFSAWQYLAYQELQQSADKQLAAIAAKAVKEITYHLRWSSEWVIRLGDGTAESHQRMEQAIDELWMYTGELFVMSNYESGLAPQGIAVNVTALKERWQQKIKAVFDEATLALPEKSFAQLGGKTGRHTEHLGHILTELQYLQRTYPGANW